MAREQRPEDIEEADNQLKSEIAKKLQWYKQQQCDSAIEIDIPSVIDDLRQLSDL